MLHNGFVPNDEELEALDLKDDVLADAKRQDQETWVHATKDHCLRGLHADWTVIGDDDIALAEQCKICSKIEIYNKVTGEVDGARYGKNHMCDLLQPWFPDGSINPLYVEIYGDPYDKMGYDMI